MSASIWRERGLRAIVAACFLALPRLALACPVCMAADARRTTAYVATTVMLSLLPLAAMGGIGWLIWRRTSTRPSALPIAAEPSSPAASAHDAVI